MESIPIPLIDIHYLPCLRYISILQYAPDVLLEQHEHFVKQTYRNRCTIYGANGRLDLIIPLKAGKSRIPIKEAEISYAVSWHKVHWKSLKAAYRSSPYFEYYEDRFAPFYEKKYRFLTDLNLELLHLVLELLKIECKILFTGSWEEKYDVPVEGKKVIDLRDKVHPRETFSETAAYGSLPYRQVFQEKYGFLDNLSVVDLLFNQGPNASRVLSET